VSNTPWQYSYESFDQGHAHSYILPVLRNALGRPCGPILDLGCGNGWLACELMGMGYEVYGVDASESGIRAARAVKPNAFFLMDVEQQNLPSELSDIPFTTVISTEVVEHLYKPRAFVSTASAILQRNGGGRLIISTPYHGYLKNLALALLGKMDSHFTVLWDGGHIKFFSRKTLQALLEEQQFQVTEFAGAGRWPFLWKSMLITARIGGAPS
jgi:2-polyprenyl-3-methyl-5-hydroxy-6-metoxy-1,4-benzoquinol methylase